ncbi:hypothetical protein F183_A52290 [Bryobacterales bacterium F-183]|nr:hypothetical protein F183_A52290 [Bryobacterales bacterium F-183]
MTVMRKLARTLTPAPYVALAATLVTAPLHAQRGPDWMTVGADAQRSNWMRTDGKITPENMAKGGFAQVWTLKPENKTRQLNALMPPSMIEFYIGYRGFRSLGFFAGSDNRAVGVDIDLGAIEWEKGMAPIGVGGGSGTLTCPGGVTTSLTRPLNTAYPPLPLGRGGMGRGTPAKSAVSEPHQGSIPLQAYEARMAAAAARPAAPPTPPPTPAAKPSMTGPGDSPFAPRVQYAVGISGDGHLHMYWISNGNEPTASIPFLPATANARGLVVYGDTAYVSTLAGCPGVPSGVWALDLASKKVTSWKASAKGVAGAMGQAAGPDGTVYVSDRSGELVALDPKTLKVLRTFKTGGAEITSSPVIFDHKGTNYAAITTADGKLHVVNATDFTKAASTAEAFGAANFQGAGLASWQDWDGNRWILASGGGSGANKNGAVTAFKFTGTSLEKGWASRDLVAPRAPVVVNGVAFLLSSGEFTTSDAKMSAADRASKSLPAVLYAYDAMTGKELWNSGSNMKSFATSGMSAGGSRIYVPAYDGTMHVFGFPMEH